MSISSSNPRQDIAADARDELEPRVLMLGSGWFPTTLGGLERYFRSLFEQLPQATAVVVGPAEDAPPSVSVVAEQSSALPRRLLGFARAARAGAPAEVIDAHFALYAALPLLAGPLRRRPTVFHFHGPWAEESVAAGDRSHWRGALRSTLERRVLASADAHVVLSSAFRRVLVERYGIAPWGVNVWAPGVELDEFTPGDRAQARASLELAEGAFVVTAVRRLVARMGLDGLLDAWAAIAGELPQGSSLLIVGDGPLRAQLAARAESIEPRGSARVLGRISEERLRDVYRAADVAAVPSLSFEGFGMVVLEAAACGTPSVVTDVGGLPEVARPLDPSLVIARADPEALARRLLEASGGALPTREQTRAYAEGFSWPRVAERHRTLHRRLIAGTRDPRPRVVYLDHIARLSGGEIALLRLLPHMRGVNAHVILGEAGPLADRLQAAGISVEVLPVGEAARDLRRDATRAGATPAGALLETSRYVARLAWRLRRLQPDLVHTNSLKAGMYGSLAATAARVPLLWHVRDRIAEDYLPRSGVRLVRALVRRLSDGVVANSTATLETLHSARDGRPHLVIPDSVELSPYPRRPPTGTVTFGMLGRIAPWKGQDLFLRAFAQTAAGGPEHAVIVGTPMFGEEDYERALHALVEELGIREQVEFRGFREDIWRELATFDVLVHASIIPEPFGQVVIEGMAAGLAVIAPDEGGPADVIEHGRTGRLFRIRDEASLATAMRRLAAEQQEREALGDGARDALGEFNPGTIAERFEAVYAQMLDR